jgi:hypothetical protein
MMILQSYFHALVVAVAGALAAFLVAVVFVIDFFLEVCVLRRTYECFVCKRNGGSKSKRKVRIHCASTTIQRQPLE